MKRVIETIIGIILATLLITFCMTPLITLLFGVDIKILFDIVGIISLVFIGWCIISFYITMIYEGYQMRKGKK